LWRKQEYPEKTTDLPQVTDKLDSKKNNNNANITCQTKQQIISQVQTT
jgi:hypothetical protein